MATRNLDPQLYEYAQAVFGADVVNDVGQVSALITERVGAAAKQPGFKASEWLQEQAEAAAKPVVFDDLTGAEAPAGPTPEQIEAARQAVSDAEKFVEMCEKFDTGVADAKVKLVEARKQLAELTGEQAEITEVPDEGKMRFEPLSEGPVPLDRNVSGPVILTPNARRVLINGPAWTEDAGKSYAVCDDACDTRFGPAFLRVYGTKTPGGIQYALTGLVKFSHLQPQPGKQPAGATILSGYGDDEAKPTEAHVLDISTDGGAWFVIKGRQKVSGGSLDTDTRRKGGSLDPR